MTAEQGSEMSSKQGAAVVGQAPVGGFASDVLGRWRFVRRVGKLIAQFGLSSGFARDATILTTGTIIAQVVNFGASPILSRLYRPEQIGQLGVLIALSGLVTPLACWRYESAIMLPEKDEDSASLFWLSLSITAVMALLATVAVTIFRDDVTALIGKSAVRSWLWAIPVLVALAGLYQAPRMLLSRRRRFGAVAAGRISRAAVSAALQIAAGALLGPRAFLLGGGYLLGLAAEAGILVSVAWRTVASTGRANVELGDLKRLGLHHRKFPMFSVPGSLATYAASEAPTLLLAALFSPAVVGLYWMSYRVLAIPTALIGDGVATVFFQRASAMRASGRSAASLVTQLSVALAVLAAIPMGLLLAFAPPLFGFVFGAEWVQAGQYARALVPMNFALFVAFPLTQAFYVYEKQGVALFWQVGCLVVMAIGFGLGAIVGPLAAIEYYSFGMAVMYGLVVALAFRWSGGALREVPGYLAEGLRGRPSGAD